MTRTTGRAGQQQARDGMAGLLKMDPSSGGTPGADAAFHNMLLTPVRPPHGRLFGRLGVFMLAVGGGGYAESNVGSPGPENPRAPGT